MYSASIHFVSIPEIHLFCLQCKQTYDVNIVTEYPYETEFLSADDFSMNNSDMGGTGGGINFSQWNQGHMNAVSPQNTGMISHHR